MIRVRVGYRKKWGALQRLESFFFESKIPAHECWMLRKRYDSPTVSRAEYTSIEFQPENLDSLRY